jgi:hypothetical protein
LQKLEKSNESMYERLTREVYNSFIPHYEKLGINLKQALEIFLKEADISYLSISYRVKDVESFLKK